MTLDEALVEQIDHAVRAMGTTRSAFTRDALRAALYELRQRELEHRHREGYAKKPVQPGELGDWEADQVWPDG